MLHGTAVVLHIWQTLVRVRRSDRGIIIIVGIVLVRYCRSIRTVVRPHASRVQPVPVPPAQKHLDVCRQSQVLDIPREPFPLYQALQESFFNVTRITKVHPMDEEMERCGIGDRKEEYRVGWRGGKETREAVGRDGEVSRLRLRMDIKGRWACVACVYEIQRRRSTEQSPEKSGLGRKVVPVKLLFWSISWTAGKMIGAGA
jgi:hypothetical protein